MKIAKNNKGEVVARITKSEWLRIGKQTKWINEIKKELIEKDKELQKK